MDIARLIAKHGRLMWNREAGEGVTLYDEKRNYYWVVINPDAVPADQFHHIRLERRSPLKCSNCRLKVLRGHINGNSHI
jgi:hypothetical protein